LSLQGNTEHYSKRCPATQQRKHDAHRLTVWPTAYSNRFACCSFVRYHSELVDVTYIQTYFRQILWRHPMRYEQWYVVKAITNIKPICHHIEQRLLYVTTRAPALRTRCIHQQYTSGTTAIVWATRLLFLVFPYYWPAYTWCTGQYCFLFGVCRRLSSCVTLHGGPAPCRQLNPGDDIMPPPISLWLHGNTKRRASSVTSR